MSSNSLRDKKGILGSFITMFIATIVIVLILVVFVLGSGIVKKWNNSGADLVIYDENKVGIDNIFDYMDRYLVLLNTKFFIEKGFTIDNSFTESGYEK